MNKCRRNILVIFACLLIVAVLFVPCTKIFKGRRKELFVFAPVYISNFIKINKLSNEYGMRIAEGENTEEIFTEIANLEKYRFKKKFFVSELLITLLAVNLVYFFLCVVFDRDKKSKKLMTKAIEATICAWLFFSSLFLVVAGVRKSNVVLYILSQTVFFIGIYVFLKLRAAKGIKDYDQ